MSMHYIKGTVWLTETMNSDIYIPFTLVHILGTPVHNLRIEAICTSLPELMYRYSSGILKIQLMWILHFICKNWNTLYKQKLLIFRDEISTLYEEIFPEFGKACLEENELQEKNRSKIHNRNRLLCYNTSWQPHEKQRTLYFAGNTTTDYSPYLCWGQDIYLQLDAVQFSAL